MFALDFGSVLGGGIQRFFTNIETVIFYTVLYLVGMFVLSLPMMFIVGFAVFLAMVGASRGASQLQLASVMAGSALLMIIVGIVIFIVSLGWFAGYLNALRKITLGQAPEFGDLFSQFGKLLQLIIFGILFYLGVFVGLILLVIPGIVVAVAWSQAFPLIVDQDMDAITAMKTSWNKVFQNFWIVFGILVVTFVCVFIVQLVLMAIAVIPVIGMLIFMVAMYLFVTPIVMMIIWNLYFALFPKEPQAQPSMTTPTPPPPPSL